MDKLRYEELISQMTLEEKASLMSGANFWNTKAIKRLNIPSMMMTDGPHGLRKQGGKADHLGLNKSLPATCFPTAATLANSWDVELLQEVGETLGLEASAEDVSVLLGPGLNIKRNPLCGRNFEYFSEDPYLTGKLAAAMINGIQSQGISACPKHFAVNSQETHRMSIDEVVDERALHEIYLEGFRYAITEGKAGSIMTSYNKVNGEYANENQYLVHDVLHEQWGFDGLVVTDWGGNNDRVAGLIAGNTLEMPSTNGMTDAEIVNAVQKGQVDENLLNKRVDTLLTVLFETRSGLGKSCNIKHHHEKAVDAACRSMVLLKNKNHILPLKQDNKRVAIIGDFAKTPRYQGAGSSLINPSRLDNALLALQASNLNIIGFEQGFKRLGGKSNSLKNKAINLAASSDIVLLFLGLDESSEAEGMDRKHMGLAGNQLELLDALYTVNKNIVLVLSGGAPIEMPFIKKVKAILHGYLGGQGSGTAIAKLLTGEYNPSGKLAESYPILYSDVPAKYPGKQAVAAHKESIYVGYRYYDKIGCSVRFPFGHGLSYTEFEYSDMEVSGNKITLTIKNIGSLDGEEVVQIYIEPLHSAVFRPRKELKAFEKVKLQIGESKRITLTLDSHAFSYYHTKKRHWVEEAGKYKIHAAASSEDIRLTKNITVIGEAINPPLNNYKNYQTGQIKKVSYKEFEQLLGHKLPKSKWNNTKQLGYNDLIIQGRKAGFFGRFLYSIIMLAHHTLKLAGKPIASNNVLFVLELPFRSVARMSGGLVNMKQLDGLLMMVNGRFWKGLRHYLKNTKKKGGK